MPRIWVRAALFLVVAWGGGRFAVGAWTPGFSEYIPPPGPNPGPTFTNATEYYYPTVVKQGGVYHMWLQNHAGLDDPWYTWSADGMTSWSTPSQCLLGGSQFSKWQLHPTVIDTGTSFRIYWSGSTRGIDVAEASYADPTSWTSLGSDIVTRGAGGQFHQDSASSHTIAQWYDAYVYQYGGHYEGFFQSDFGLHYGTSPDGITNWTAVNSVPNTTPPPTDTTGPPVFQKGAAGQWDSATIGKPTVLRLADDEYHMFYGSGKVGDPVQYAAGIGYATSSDGINWTRDASPLFHVSDGIAFRDRRTYTPWVMIDGNEVRMYFSAEDQDGGRPDAIGLAISPFQQTQAVPEPSSLAILLGLSFASFLGSLWRRRRSRGTCGYPTALVST